MRSAARLDAAIQARLPAPATGSGYWLSFATRYLTTAIVWS
jgi:hypothetical protein